jgi:polysaccharide pyruvyl transferase WcaK-like protein
MKIFFKGYYGFNNVGDDIFVHIAKWYCENINKEAQPLLVGEDLPQGIQYRRASNNYKKNIIEILYLFQADYIIYWGGSTLGNLNGYTNLKYWINKSRYLQKKFLAFGVSVGPFENQYNQNSILNLLSKSEYIGVRDYKSLEYSQNYKFTFDLAILTPNVFPYKPKEFDPKKWTIGINFNKSKNSEEYYDFLEKLCLKEKPKINLIKIFIFNKYEKEEKQYSERLKNKLMAEGLDVNIYYYTNDTNRYIKDFIDIDFLFGTRLHSAIIAYSYGIKFVLNEYHEKCTSFVETINNPIRYEDLTDNFELSDINNFDYTKLVDVDHFKQKLLYELDNITKLIKK